MIELQAGATYTGNFTLPNKSGTGWIYIQSSALASLVPADTRVGPAHSVLMPRIVTPNSSSALTTATNAHHYRFIGVEVTGTLADTTATQFGLIALDSGADFVFDRCYIHGTPTGNYKRGIQLNSARTAVIDSYLADFHSTVQDAQAILGWNGPGPFKLVNNYIEGSGENVMFGGADPSVPNLVPSDIAGGNYRLSALSPYKNAGTDGDDIGVDFNLLDLATSCASSGVCASDPDMIPPTVAISAPALGAMVVGTITVSASATDNVGTVGVQFELDGANLGAEVTSAPYSVSWNTRNVLDGTHLLAAVARDAAGNTATSAGISVTLVNADATPPAVTITSPTSSSAYSTSASLLTLGGLASDNTRVATVTWTNDRGGSGTATGTTSWTAGGIVLQLGTNVLTVTAQDAAGNGATATVTVTLTATFTFTDDPLTAQGTLLTAHILEVRAAVDSLRVSRGLATFAWTDLTLSPGSTSVKVVHVSELRTALNQAYQAAGRALPIYTDPTPTPGQTVVNAVHLTELRAAARALQDVLNGPSARATPTAFTGESVL
ncbi:MAG: hypothetical protein DME04_05950 [Candidatus Rokuibacteriota bacterium]|nr:MAG: hypothetical protein DME04_05950 [Candidatus Rokubacteria bacterium]